MPKLTRTVALATRRRIVYEDRQPRARESEFSRRTMINFKLPFTRSQRELLLAAAAKANMSPQRLLIMLVNREVARSGTGAM